ncbi:MAG TPA: LAGLIDADG family homing endonuclease [Candidatus Saccharimonadia bacterium]|nr:LAGLIDADG family homing endonuclease [Candidatus Saccharimonadia bacterium]
MVNTVGKNISAVNESYTAGFLDADGAIMATIERHKEKRYGFRIRVIVKITQKNKTIVDWFRTQYSIGNVVHNRATYDWIIRDQSDAYSFIKQLEPYIIVKRKQALIALQILDHKISSKEDLISVALLADTLSSYNVRSKLRRRNYSLMIQEVFSRND